MVLAPGLGMFERRAQYTIQIIVAHGSSTQAIDYSNNAFQLGDFWLLTADISGCSTASLGY